MPEVTQPSPIKPSWPTRHKKRKKPRPTQEDKPNKADEDLPDSEHLPHGNHISIDDYA